MWAVFGKQSWRCGINRKQKRRSQNFSLIKTIVKCVSSLRHRECKNGSSNRLRSCVKAHTTNGDATKMNGAKVGFVRDFVVVILYNLYLNL